VLAFSLQDKAPPKPRDKNAFDADAAFAYAIKYGAKGGNNCKSGQFTDDTAHFIAHVMAAGGFRFDKLLEQTALAEKTCASRLPMDPDQFLDFMDDMSRKGKVKIIKSFQEARRGDLVFVASQEKEKRDSPRMMLLGEAPQRRTKTVGGKSVVDFEGGRVYSHNPKLGTADGKGALTPFSVEQGAVYYRILRTE
jgi:hypothetical protein